jgi:hypothetical protein
VEPHVKTSREEALDVAYKMALDSLMETEENEDILNSLKWASQGLEAKIHPVKLDEKTMQLYAGTYGPRTISFEDGKLYYQRTERPKMLMKPITKDTFGFDEVPYFRLKVIMENGKSVAVEGHYDNGNVDRNERSK